MVDCGSSYTEKLTALEKELRKKHKERIKAKKKFNENQQKVYDFVIGISEMMQFNIKGKQYFLNRGNKETGFEHILLRHYGHNCEGKLTADNILNIATTIKMGSSYPSEKNGYISLSNEFNGERYIVVLNQDNNGHWVVSYYSVE